MIRLDKKWIIFVALIMVAQVLFAPLACAADWHMFRHDARHTGYTDESIPDDLELLWSYETGCSVGSSPAVADGKVFFGSYDHNIYCLDENNGRLIWSYEAGGCVYSSPAVADGKVFVGSDYLDRKIYCLDENSGKLIWSYETGDSVSSPTVTNGKVFFSSYDRKIYCLDEDTGNLIWSYETGNYVSSSPAVADGKVFVGSIHGNKIYCLDEDTGNLIWSYETESSVYSSPAVANGKVFVGSDDHKLYCLDEDTGNLIWSYKTGSWVRSSPAVADGKVFVGSSSPDNKLYCIDENTGKLVWSYETGSGIVYSSPAVANGKVFVGSNDNNIYCLDEDTGNLIWSYETGSFVHSSPAIANGKVFVGSTDNNIYCFDAKSTPTPTVAPIATPEATPIARVTPRVEVDTPTPFGYIHVSSTPSGADIYLDGAYKGTTPATIPDVSPGSHALKLEKYGCKEWLTSVYVTSGVTESITAHLTNADVSPPAIRIDKPAIIDQNNNELLEEGEKVTITYGANDPSGVTSIKILIDGTMLESRNGAGTYTVTTNSLPVGEHVIRVVATDSKSNRGFEELPITVERTGPSVYFGTTRTTISKGEDAIFTLSAVNPIGNPPMTVQLILKPPTGVSVTSSSFAKAGSGIYTCTHAIESGDNVRSIEVRLTGNEVGTHEIESEVYYMFEGSSKSPTRYETLTLVVDDPDSTPLTPTPKPSSGFAAVIAITGLLAAYLRRRRI